MGRIWFGSIVKLERESNQFANSFDKFFHGCLHCIEQQLMVDRKNKPSLFYKKKMSLFSKKT